LIHGVQLLVKPAAFHAFDRFKTACLNEEHIVLDHVEEIVKILRTRRIGMQVFDELEQEVSLK
jgi:hypothetical protein